MTPPNVEQYLHISKQFDLQEDGLTDWTYIVRDALSNRVKIGTSKRPTRRLRALQAYSPNVLEVLLIISPYVTTHGGIWFRGSTEKELHRRFAKDRLHGEWFKYTPEIQQFIADMIAEGA
jgi:hypothetical protein